MISWSTNNIRETGLWRLFLFWEIDRATGLQRSGQLVSWHGKMRGEPGDGKATMSVTALLPYDTYGPKG